MYTIFLGQLTKLLNEEGAEISFTSRNLPDYVKDINKFNYGSANGPNNDVINMYIKKLTQAPITTIGIQYIAPASKTGDFNYLSHFNPETLMTIHIDAPIQISARLLTAVLQPFSKLQDLLLAQVTFTDVDAESTAYFQSLYNEGKLKAYGTAERFNQLLDSLGVARATPAASSSLTPLSAPVVDKPISKTFGNS